MTTLQIAAASDLPRSLSECVDPGDAEIWSGEWRGPEFTTRTVDDRTVLTAPNWPALPPRSIATAYLLLLLLGVLGAHHFYLRNRWRAGLYLLTAGGLGIGLAIDLFTLPRQLRRTNALRLLGIRQG